MYLSVQTGPCCVERLLWYCSEAYHPLLIIGVLRLPLCHFYPDLEHHLEHCTRFDTLPQSRISRFSKDTFTVWTLTRISCTSSWTPQSFVNCCQHKLSNTLSDDSTKSVLNLSAGTKTQSSDWFQLFGSSFIKQTSTENPDGAVHGCCGVCGATEMDYYVFTLMVHESHS